MSPRILCLHGYLQTGSSFSNRLGHLRKANPFKREGCAFVFLDAPYLVVPDGEEEEGHRQVLASTVEAADAVIGRSWWQFGTASSSGVRPSQSYEYAGMQVSVDLIRAAVREHNIDTILGFSQGACMAAYFCATEDVQSLGIKRLIAYAGFLPKDPVVAERMLDRAPRDCPASLWVAGLADEMIPVERSKAAAAVFDGALFLEHPGGHMVPTTKGEIKTTLAEFLCVGGFE